MNHEQQIAARPNARSPAAAWLSCPALRPEPKELLWRQRRQVGEDVDLSRTRKRWQIDRSLAKRWGSAASGWKVFAAKEEGNE
jgi:hypothetical protein